MPCGVCWLAGLPWDLPPSAKIVNKRSIEVKSAIVSPTPHSCTAHFMALAARLVFSHVLCENRSFTNCFVVTKVLPGLYNGTLPAIWVNELSNLG